MSTLLNGKVNVRPCAGPSRTHPAESAHHRGAERRESIRRRPPSWASNCVRAPVRRRQPRLAMWLDRGYRGVTRYVVLCRASRARDERTCTRRHMLQHPRSTARLAQNRILGVLNRAIGRPWPLAKKPSAARAHGRTRGASLALALARCSRSVRKAGVEPAQMNSALRALSLECEPSHHCGAIELANRRQEVVQRSRFARHEQRVPTGELHPPCVGRQWHLSPTAFECPC